MHPQNVFVMPGSGGQSERIKILDFGISKIASISQKITGMAAVMGTPQYMSPEQAEGKTDELDAASDQFSLAAIVYEMLTGRKAFSGETLASVAYQIVHATPAPITEPPSRSCRSRWRTSSRARWPRTSGTDSRRCRSSRSTCGGRPRCPPAMRRARKGPSPARRCDPDRFGHGGDDRGLRVAVGDGGGHSREHRPAVTGGAAVDNELTVVSPPSADALIGAAANGGGGDTRSRRQPASRVSRAGARCTSRPS